MLFRSAGDVASQVFTLFPAFRTKVAELAAAREACPCGACQNIRNLRLKAIAHLGEAAFRKIRQFEELAGEDVILVHRLLKNSVPFREYVLLTERFPVPAETPAGWTAQRIVERTSDVGVVGLHVFAPSSAA